MIPVSIQHASQRFAKLFLLAALVFLPLSQTGCRHRVLDAVEDLQPEAEQRNQQLEELAKPSSKEE